MIATILGRLWGRTVETPGRRVGSHGLQSPWRARFALLQDVALEPGENTDSVHGECEKACRKAWANPDYEEQCPDLLGQGAGELKYQT
ncbi:MAG: hypothetical protein GY811_26910 [Myxococcales bacterium]|nr:hypothetical protein [Myxococcales bacterium]